MRHSAIRIKFIILFSTFLSAAQGAYSQVNAADSLWFASLFDQPRYADDSAFPGNWYVNDTIHCIAEMYAKFDAEFKYNLADFDSITTMQVIDTLRYDSVRNNTYNSYPFVFQQNNPMVGVDYTLNAKSSSAWSMYYPAADSEKARYAFFIIPGNGSNCATEIVQGYGYHNTLCFVHNTLRQQGDVYSMIKPNEDARAMYYEKNKLNHIFLATQLDSINRPYGLNYLSEAIATINFLKKKYCKVIILGLSEGGYTALLASMITHPDGAMISAGYAVGFDTSWASYFYLQEKFDSLVFRFDKNTIRGNISANQTKYLFTYGDFDYVNLMQAEHDSNFTQQFLNDSLHCSFFYNFFEHTFPQCSVIDSFVNGVRRKPSVDFFIPYTSGPDTLMVLVSNCSVSKYSFDLYRNDTLFKSFAQVNPDTLITLIDSGKYYLRNIVNEWGDSSICDDTLVFYKVTPPVPNFITSFDDGLDIRVNNPVVDQLNITLNNKENKRYSYQIRDLYGVLKRKQQANTAQVSIDMQGLSPGIYFLHVSDGLHHYTAKLIRL